MSLYNKRNLNEWSYLWVIFIALLVNLFFQTSEFFAELVGDKPETWFQRSGSVIVVLAVFFELSALRKQLLVKEKTNSDSDGFYLLLSQIFSYAMAMCALFGTVIWGYGDLIYLALK